MKSSDKYSEENEEIQGEIEGGGSKSGKEEEETKKERKIAFVRDVREDPFINVPVRQRTLRRKRKLRE